MKKNTRKKIVLIVLITDSRTLEELNRKKEGQKRFRLEKCDAYPWRGSSRSAV